MNSINDLPQIEFFIPAMAKRETKESHHVISRGQNPDFYKREELRDKGTGKTAWVDAFEKILVGLYIASGEAVPYAFKTPDGVIRSLDAGCIKMLLNRGDTEIEIISDSSGFIDRVRPGRAMLERYEPIKDRLVKAVREAQANM